MLPVTTARWILVLLLRRPSTWLWATFVAATWPAVAAFTPLGTTTANAGNAPALYEVAFVASLLGVLAGTAILQRGAWFLAALAPARRLVVELSALSAAGLLFLLAGLLPGLLLGEGTALRPDHIPLGAAVCLLHLAAIALVLLRLPLSPTARLAALPLLVWVLPSLLPEAGPVGYLVHADLGVARHLDPARGTVLAPHAWKAVFGPIIGLLGAAFLLARSPLAPYALRHPR
ncbi:MAG: hypothetical protein E2O39_02505 [Planctomycetota bacterium]|nr:MAG: hypothetical protein E2O39_02505 [Planctomycetota bacterium]